MELHLMRPEWLWSLLPALALFLLLWRLRGQRGSWNTVIAPELLRHLVGAQGVRRSRNLLPLLLVAWLLAGLAASGPSWRKIPQPIHQKQDAMVLLLDLSYSMKSGDLAPSRLERARQKLLDLLELRREGQTGLIAYAGDAHIVTPLTDDTLTIANLLPALHPDMMPVAGSDAGGAVAQGLELLRSAGIRDGAMLLVTDGVSDRAAKKIVKALRGSSVRLDVMGVGTATGAPIPLPRGGFLKDDTGTIVMPGLDEPGLRGLAADSGGRYIPMRINDSDLDYLLAATPLLDTRQTLALDRTADTWEDQGYLLVLALLPLALALFRRGWLFCLLPLLLVGSPQPASAQSWSDLWLTPDQQGRRALERGDPETAAELFSNPDWAGTAAYEGGDYEAAVSHFGTGDSADRLYNRGNALARAGQLDEAIAAYRASLQREPGRRDAEDNLALLERLREQQQQQEQERRQEQQEQEQGPPQQEQGQDQQQQGQSGEDSSQPDKDGESQGTRDQQQAGKEEQDRGADAAREEASHGEQQAQSGAEPGEQAADDARAGPGAEQEQEQPGQEPGQMARAGEQDSERDQEMEQWLRRVPDDPSGLLREKFRYESRLRHEQGEGGESETLW